MNLDLKYGLVDKDISTAFKTMHGYIKNLIFTEQYKFGLVHCLLMTAFSVLKCFIFRNVISRKIRRQCFCYLWDECNDSVMTSSTRQQMEKFQDTTYVPEITTVHQGIYSICMVYIYNRTFPFKSELLYFQGLSNGPQ